MTIDRINVCSGISMPFYPARPITGVALRTPDQAQAQFERDMDLGHLIQPKLCGDRACLGVTAEGLHVQNRRGGWLSQRVRNRALFQELRAGTVLDGEIIDGEFLPFECLAVDGTSLIMTPTAERIRVAELLCSQIGVSWVFAPPTVAFIRDLRANLPHWEGYVAKANLPYPLGRSASDESPRYVKVKW